MSTQSASSYKFGSQTLNEWMWIGILTAASPLFTVFLACATPFVAFATLAALNMRSRSAAVLIGFVWFVNQAVGYGCLGYPWTAASFGWGIALGGASYVALFTAQRISGSLRAASEAVATAGALISAFVAFKAVIFGVSYILAGTGSAFTWPVVGRTFAVNTLALVALLLLHRMALQVGLLRPMEVENSGLARLA
jgi:hypothetical protein